MSEVVADGLHRQAAVQKVLGAGVPQGVNTLLITRR